jgi:hypothetical protein
VWGVGGIDKVFGVKIGWPFGRCLLCSISKWYVICFELLVDGEVEFYFSTIHNIHSLIEERIVIVE